MSIGIESQIGNFIEKYQRLPFAPIGIVMEWRNDESSKCSRFVKKIAAAPVLAIYAPIIGSINAISSVALGIFSSILGKKEIADKLFMNALASAIVTIMPPTIGLFQNLFYKEAALFQD